jgi:hypothetical protein
MKEQFERSKTFRSRKPIQQIRYSGSVERITGRPPEYRSQLQSV